MAGYYKRDMGVVSRSTMAAAPVEVSKAVKRWRTPIITALAIAIPLVLRVFGIDLFITMPPALILHALLVGCYNKDKVILMGTGLCIAVPAAELFMFTGVTAEDVSAALILIAGCLGIELILSYVRAHFWKNEFLATTLPAIILYFYIIVTNGNATATSLVKMIITIIVTILLVLATKVLLMEGKLKLWLLS